MSMTVVKNVVNLVAKPITHICYLSFMCGILPGKMIIARVIHLFKSGDTYAFTNYRPVPLPPQFSTIVETLFNNLLMNFMEKYNILYNGQCGLRKIMSISLALRLEEINTNIDERNATICVFTDFKKVFDTIDHSLLINEPAFYGIRGVASYWLKSYLATRQQFVTVNNSDSDLLTIKCGEPRGSIIIPTLFLLYINDLRMVS